jgi:hypothetical protein
MKRFPKKLLIGLFLGSLAFAGTGLDSPQGDPPFGLKVQGDAKGTKLDGVVSIEFFNSFDCSFDNSLTCSEAKIVLRLRQGNTNQLQMFVGDLAEVQKGSPNAVQTAITDALGTQVTEAFFGQTLTVKLKNVTEFGKIEDGLSIFILANVQIAVS